MIRTRNEVIPLEKNQLISLSGSEQCSWLGWTRAGEDACGPRTMVLIYFRRLCCEVIVINYLNSYSGSIKFSQTETIEDFVVTRSRFSKKIDRDLLA